MQANPFHDQSPPRTRPQHQHAPPAGRSGRSALRADLGASFVVFLVALPLSLGIALASGAPIIAGLVAAVVGGIVAGLLGGSPLQVSGPAAGLTVVVAELVATLGWQLTCLVTVGAGLLQILFGLARVARFAQAVPPAVAHGMLGGIGLTIALSQLHVVLGATPPSGTVAGLLALPERLATIHPQALAAGTLTIAVMIIWPRLPPRVRVVPGPLAAVVAGTALAMLWPGAALVELPDDLTATFGTPSILATLLPDVVADGRWVAVLGGILTVALVASVESLLSAVAVDRMHEGPRADTDRELVGQGAANGLSGLLGGLPVTGVIVRSAANVAAGARTRRSAVLHGCWVALFTVVLARFVELVPMAALAGLLVVIGAGLVKVADLRSARRHGELSVYLVTVAGVLTLTLIEGVALGLALAGLLMLRRVLAARVRIEPDGGDDGARRVVVEGLLSFLAVPALARVLAAVPAGATVRVDLVVDYLDHAAYDHLDAWTRRHRAGGGQVTVVEPPDPVVTSGGRYATWSQWQSAHWQGPDGAGAAGPVLAGVAAFHSTVAELIRPAMRVLAAGQQPAALMLGCSDSRVSPDMITQSAPGDVFTVRNVGNLVAGTSARAAVQYATDVLEVPLIAVCGHSGCGAMHAVLGGGAGGHLADWLEGAAPSLDALRAGHPVGRAALAAGRCEVDALAMVNVAVQLETLRAEVPGTEVLGLFFDIASAQVLVLDDATHSFGPAG